MKNNAIDKKVFASLEVIDYCNKNKIDLNNIMHDESLYEYKYNNTLRSILLCNDNTSYNNTSSIMHNGIKITYHRTMDNDILILDILSKDDINKEINLSFTNEISKELEDTINLNIFNYTQLFHKNQSYDNPIVHCHLKNLDVVAVLEIESENRITILDFITDI